MNLWSNSQKPNAIYPLEISQSDTMLRNQLSFGMHFLLDEPLRLIGAKQWYSKYGHYWPVDLS